MKNDSPLHPYGQKRIGRINVRGIWTLYLKEVMRFFKVFMQTIMAPTITTFLFMTVFTVALGRDRYVGELSFQMFLAPGLIMMAIVQNAFANTSSSMMAAKMQGNITDILLAPLGPTEIILGFALGGITRGLLVGSFIGLTMLMFVDLAIHHVWAVLYYSIAASLLLSLMGILTGVWAEKFDQSAGINNFIIVPLSFLSGTFYSIHALPGIWYSLSQLNPFFYVIDGFRYGLTGQSDAPLLTGVILLGILNIALWLCCYYILKSGYKLRT